MTLEDQLNKFRVAYPGIRVTQLDDCLVYKVTANYAHAACLGANSLIHNLCLDLIAEPSKTIPHDSFIIKQKQHESAEKTR